MNKKTVFNKPKVSIIMPCYNGEEFIGEAIESVLNQTYQNWELIIINDGSTDSSDKIIYNYLSDRRIRYINNTQNRGIPVARNIGIGVSKGEFIAFLDQDDLWLSEKIKRQVKIFEGDKEKKIGLIFSDLLFLKNGKVNKRSWPSKRVPKNLETIPFEEVTKILFIYNFIPTVTVLIRKECFANLGLLDENLIWGADDYEFFMRLVIIFRLKYIDCPLAIRREHKTNFSKMENFFKDEIFIIEKIIKKHPQLQELKKFKLAELYYRSSIDYQIRDKYLAAKRELFKAIKLNPWNVKYLLLLVICLLGRFGNWLIKKIIRIKEENGSIIWDGKYHSFKKN